MLTLRCGSGAEKKRCCDKSNPTGRVHSFYSVNSVTNIDETLKLGFYRKMHFNAKPTHERIRLVTERDMVYNMHENGTIKSF